MYIKTPFDAYIYLETPQYMYMASEFSWVVHSTMGGNADIWWFQSNFVSVEVQKRHFE